MIDLRKITQLETNKLKLKAVKLKQKGWTYEDVALHCDTSAYTIRNIVRKAKQSGLEFPNIVGFHPYHTQPLLQLPKPLVMSERRQALMEPKKAIKTIKITKHFSATKDFWLFR